ncbi:hypothetical protein M431DRAFT_490746 [Trichoderma harzianum CBS 226.95]|uniref:Uncharacterized protein n=1 Tax=Trichoderma harzianum CBS 226.95 TaxID=983964 RepID=A0A2T4APX3_TRIHA|nr:hypothetical protein M431DRAFT_490746 [Trichoderma harzianum CBS 226.95]PTB59124.1 hypothetical protein M431DRAFT_490746 [Trichoderma harzianum CBS 226.95]
MIRLFACVDRHLQPLLPASLSLLASPVLARRQVKCLASASTTLNRYSRHTRKKTVYSIKQMNSNPTVLKSYYWFSVQGTGGPGEAASERAATWETCPSRQFPGPGKRKKFMTAVLRIEGSSSREQALKANAKCN